MNVLVVEWLKEIFLFSLLFIWGIMEMFFEVFVLYLWKVVELVIF